MNRLILTVVFACCFTLATELAPMFESIEARSGTAGDPLLVLVGDSRRAFANQFFSMADRYFHSGYYPTIFDARKKGAANHLDVAVHEEPGAKPEADDDDNFMGKPRDKIEEFGRNFIPTVHTHLTGQSAEEILPWLKLSAEMDPKRIDTYVTASFWLRTQLNQPKEAERFLREGLRANPDSYEILLELGRVDFYSRSAPEVARNIWNEALEKWQAQEKAGLKPDPAGRDEILGEFVREDEKVGNLQQLLADLEELKKDSIGTGSLEKYIEDVKERIAHPQ